MSDLQIDIAACQGRQGRLLENMAELDVELTIVTQMEHVQWLTGAWFGPMFQPAAALWADGHALLVAPVRDGASPPGGFAVDEVVGYEAKWHSTLRNDQRESSSDVLLTQLADRPTPARIGVEFSSFGPHLAAALPIEMLDIEPLLYYLRRQKDADELHLMRRAIDACGAMYARAREVIEPGVNELDVYNELQSVAVRELGEALTYFGQDFQSGSRGGLPRDREAQAGELYILDLGAGFRGYFSDNARTICVDGRPTDVQLRAWEAVVSVFPIVEVSVRPGASCRELFERVQTHLDQYSPWQFNHHLGHGVGLFPHEAPHLNPHWDDGFEEGDFFTVEPGLYHEELQHGIRIEQNYLVIETGVERLTDFPLEL